MRQEVQEAIDKGVGAIATLAGSAGLTVQWWVGVGNLVLLGLNIALAAGGLYLLWLRIKRARRDNKK